MTIERPKRSVTRFFVPLIDVLILLFCIFLLMPFVSTASDPNAVPPDSESESKKDDLPKDAEQLKAELEKVNRENQRLRNQLSKRPTERISVCVLEIDPPTGKLVWYDSGKKIELNDRGTAQSVVDEHKRRSGTKDPYFMIMLPRELKYSPTVAELNKFVSWFKSIGKIEFEVNDPFAVR